MGLAIIVPNVDFGDTNLGKVTISGNVPIRGLQIKLNDSYTTSVIDLKCSYLPIHTTQRDVLWSIESGNEYAIVSGSKLIILSNASDSDIVLKCTSVSNPSVFDIKTVKVTYSSEEITWSDFNNDMIVKQRAIDSNNGAIFEALTAIRWVLLVPIPQGASVLRLKHISGTFTSTTVSFVGIDNLSNPPISSNHFLNWLVDDNNEISIPIQDGDVSFVCWQRIDSNIYGIGNVVYKFE